MRTRSISGSAILFRVALPAALLALPLAACRGGTLQAIMSDERPRGVREVAAAEPAYEEPFLGEGSPDEPTPFEMPAPHLAGPDTSNVAPTAPYVPGPDPFVPDRTAEPLPPFDTAPFVEASDGPSLAGSAGIPAPPPPPAWDAGRDRKVVRDENGRPVAAELPIDAPAPPCAATPADVVPGDMGSPDVGSPDSVVLPPLASPLARGVSTPRHPQATAEDLNAASSDELGDAPALGGDVHQPSSAGSSGAGGTSSHSPVPVAPRERADAAPAVAPPARPLPEPVKPAFAHEDPWLPGGGTVAPAAPPAPQASFPAQRPSEAPAPRETARQASPVSSEDSWIPGGTTAPAAPPPAPHRLPAPTPVPPDAPATAPATAGRAAPADDPWIAGGSTAPVAPPLPSRPVPPPSAPAPMPWDAPPTGTPPTTTLPTTTLPTSTLPSVPRADAPYEPAPAAPAPSETSPQPPGERNGFTFSGTPEQRAADHANRLLAAPEDPTVHGYPPEVVRRADAKLALEPGTKPVVILFYDDTARASNLQAAEFLPVLARHRDVVDVVAIDVTAAATWTPEEKKLVRNFYVAYVPTTVVLSAQRKPLLLKYQRISGAMLDATLERETRR